MNEIRNQFLNEDSNSLELNEKRVSNESHESGRASFSQASNSPPTSVNKVHANATDFCQ